MPGCPYFIANTFIHLFGGLFLTALSAEHPLTTDIGKKPFSHVAIFIITLGCLFGMYSLDVGIPKYIVFGIFCLLLGQNLTGFEQLLERKGVLNSVLLQTAGVFITMALVGLVDSQNMLEWGNYLFAALIGLLITMIVSAFLYEGENKNTVSMWISRAVVILFALYTAFDVEILKENAKLCKGNPDYVKESINLYLDAINLFTGIGGSK